MKKRKIKLTIFSAIILSLITIGGVFLPLDFAFSQSYTVEFSGHLQPWGNPAGTISFMEGSINLPRYGRYEVSTYYNANSGRGQLHEEYKVLVDGNYIGQTSDPNSTPNGPDYETEYFGERNFTAGNHQIRLEHLWNYAEVGYQSVHPKKVTFTLREAFSPELSFRKSVDRSTAQEGDILTYILSYRNRGDGSASAVVISDDYDENHLDIYDAGGGTVSGGKISWNIGTLAADTSGTRIFKVKVKDELPLGTTYIYNKATISSNETSPLESNIARTTVTIRNQPPVADAGPDKKIEEGHLVTLSGKGTDPEGDAITYRWSCAGGYLSDPYIPKPSFTAPQVSYHRTYTCTLKVTDDKGLSDSDSMKVQIINKPFSPNLSSPDVETNAAINVQTKSAVLTGYLKDLGGANSAKVWFQWGRNSTYGNETSHRSKGSIGSFNFGVYNLSPATTYYFRAVAENEAGNSYGVRRSFITKGVKGVTDERASLSVKKSVKNVSRGDTTWYNSYRSASPSDKLLFKIVVKSTGDATAQNVKVKDTLPSKIIYQGKLKIDNVSQTKNISTGAINIGNLSPGKSKTITFEAKVASAGSFSYGTTELINGARAYTSQTSDTDTCKVKVTRKAVAGAVTAVSTGITNGILDSILLPLGIALLMVWIFRSKLIGLDKWAQDRKKEIGEYRAKKTLKRKITQLKSKGYFKE